MRGAFAAVAVLVAAGLVAADEKKYESKDGKFVVAFPAGKEVKSTSEVLFGQKYSTVSVLEKEVVRMVFLLEPLAETTDLSVRKRIMDVLQVWTLDKFEGKPLKSAETTFGSGKLPARDVLVEKDGDKIRALIILDGSRGYVVLVGGPKDYATGKEASAFVESFELKK